MLVTRKSLPSRAVEIFREEGVRSLSRKALTYLLGYYYYTIFKSSRTFIFQGNTYNYLYHRYNTTWANERAVEVPIVWKIVGEFQRDGGRILEVGNVLSHYFNTYHDIIDKYEKADGAINEDIADFQPHGKYDLIVSISTLEHVGWNEKPREYHKILKTIENLKNILLPDGKIITTLPLGYNSDIDELLESGKLEFNKEYYLERITEDNKWMEANKSDVLGVKKYGKPFPHANGLVIGIIG